jgi:hypothetical protein
MVLLDRYHAFRSLDETTFVHHIDRHPERGANPALYQWRS